MRCGYFHRSKLCFKHCRKQSLLGVLYEYIDGVFELIDTLETDTSSIRYALEA